MSEFDCPVKDCGRRACNPAKCKLYKEATNRGGVEMSESVFIDLKCNKSCRHIRELEQQLTELKESQKQKQITRLCNRLDEAEQQNKELIEDLIEYIKAVYSVSGLINIKSKNLIESVTGKSIDELLK